MNTEGLINLCAECGSYNDFIQTPDGRVWFVCRRCGGNQFVTEEMDEKYLREGEKNG